VTVYPEHFLLFLLPLVTAGITAFYMFRLWFMTFTGEPRDQHVYDHAHESPWAMTIPLVILAFFSIVVAWGLPPWDVRESKLEHVLHHEQPKPYQYKIPDEKEPGRELANLAMDRHLQPVVRQFETNEYERPLGIPGPHDLVGILALLSAGIGVILALIVYFYGYLDPADTKAQFPGVFSFLWHKWHFDELYRWMFVRPIMVIAGICRWFDAKVIEGLINGTGRATVRTSRDSGRFDLGIVDGLVNLMAKVVYGVGNWLRVFQTGLIRNYVLYLALAAVGIFAVVSYVMALAG
jgi:NADH-quinone oxidoreductase subunit L